MTRTRKIISVIGVSLVALVLIVILGGIVLVQTDGFRNYVRAKIIATTADATGGTVEMGAFDFEWSHLRATVRDL